MKPGADGRYRLASLASVGIALAAWLAASWLGRTLPV
jgi:hypothetical protein